MSEFHQWHLHPRRSRCSHRFEVTDNKGHEVRAHRHRFAKLVFQEAIVHLHRFHLKFTHANISCNMLSTSTNWVSKLRPWTYNRHVGQRNVLGTPPNLHSEVSFEARFIKTGERHPSTCGLEVGGGQGSVGKNQHSYRTMQYGMETANFLCQRSFGYM